MKIVIVDGIQAADYVIKKYNTKRNDLIVINNNEEACHYLSLNNDIPVMFGKGTRESDLREIGAEDADLFIALSESDMDNYVACQTAKKLLNAKRCVTTVLNPKNVELFRDLGIDNVLCSTYLLGEQIGHSAKFDNMINNLSLEDDGVNILELKVAENLKINGMTIKDINISDIASISLIIRDHKSIIPNGNIELQANDKVLLVTTEENQNAVIKVFNRKK